MPLDYWNILVELQLTAVILFLTGVPGQLHQHWFHQHRHAEPSASGDSGKVRRILKGPSGTQ